MRSRWDDAAAAAEVARLAPEWGEDLALRVYTSRLLGADGDLVLHGGGNTSVKTTRKNLLGEDRDVVCVKGSGQNLGTIEPEGLPALDLAGLCRLLVLDELSDEDMVNQLRLHLLDASSPTPSIETLLHAYLPDKFVDHSHANVAMVFGNRPEGPAEMREVAGADVGVLPWIMPGFPLAKAVAEFRDENPDAIGLILLHHGVFSWGPDARTSYERHIEIVSRLENAITDRLAGTETILGATVDATGARAVAADCAPVIRRLLAESTGDDLAPHRPLVLEWRATAAALAAAAHPEAAALYATMPLTPDHVIRTKSAYVVAKPDEESLAEAVAHSCGSYIDYFEDCAKDAAPRPAMADPYPRVVLVEGGGLFAWGRTKRDAVIAADIAEYTITGKAQAHALSSYEGLPAADVFSIEYWSRELAKLDSSPEPALARQIALVTGAAGAIGRSVSRRLLELGAHVVLTDIADEPLESARAELAEIGGHRVHAVRMDVTDEASVEAAFDECVVTFGGLDIVVANAGIAHVSAIADLAVSDWERVIKVNETGTFLCFRAAARVMKRQKLGGKIILNASKNVPAPGADFVAYSASKAAAVQVAKVAAIELAPLGVLVNLVHPDGVFEDSNSGKSSGLWDMVGEERMRSRGMSPEELRAHYRDRNLLGIAISADHVAEAVAFFAAGRTPTTGAALTVDGGLKETFYR